MARRAVACVVVVAVAATSCGGTTKRAPAPPPGPRLTPQLARALDAQLRGDYDDEHVAGVSAAIVFPDGREWSAADGFAVAASKQRMTPHTSLPFDSVTKTATAALALRYAEEGRLSLDDPIKRWYAAWNGDPRATVRELLGHVAGARDPREAFYVRVATHPHAVVAPRQVVAATPGAGRPTREAVYSNTGFVIAGLILQRAGRQSVAAGMRRDLFDHPGGAGLALQPAERAHPPRAHSYWYPHGIGNERADLNDASGLLPFRSVTYAAWTAGALAGDVPSLARWAHQLLGGRILKPDSLRQMTRFHPGAFWQGYGLGLARDTLDGRTLWGHTGDGFGSHTELWHVPNEDLTVAVSWNDDTLDREAVFLPHLLRTVWASEPRSANAPAAGP
jgi:D-alanyl-D-alanine carboxypeptidase